MIEARTAAALAISEQAPALARELLRCERAAPPNADTVWAKSEEDARLHFVVLARALEFGRPQLFSSQMAWVKAVLAHRNVPSAALAHHLRCMDDVLETHLAPAPGREAVSYVRQALLALPGAPDSLDPQIGKLPTLAQQYLERMLVLDAEGARRLVADSMRHGLGMGELYLQVIEPAMREVGLLWQAGRISVAQEHYCTGVTRMAIAHIAVDSAAIRPSRTAVVACVAGELHELGSRMVADFLEATGWRTLWLGASTPTADLLRIAIDLRADLLALSCAHAPNLHDLAALIAGVRALPELRELKVLVGGHAFRHCEELWQDVGADAYAADAAQAVQRAEALCPSR